MLFLLLSYCWYGRVGGMAARPKRSISLPAELDAAVERAAVLQGTTVSGWLAETAAHRLQLEAGWYGLEQWESEHGRLTDEELAEGRAWAKGVVGSRVAGSATGAP